MVSGRASLRPRKRTLPSSTSRAMAPTVSSIGTVLIIQIDHLDAEALQTGLAGSDHVLRPPVGYFAAAAAEIAELGRHEDLGAAPRDGLADKRFIVPEAIH